MSAYLEVIYGWSALVTLEKGTEEDFLDRMRDRAYGYSVNPVNGKKVSIGSGFQPGSDEKIEVYAGFNLSPDLALYKPELVVTQTDPKDIPEADVQACYEILKDFVLECADAESLEFRKGLIIYRFD